MRKQKVAVLGGGMASIVAAFELTNTPELRERYEVTVYQLGWRLGGKCASGRNAEYGQRVEEHGLHVWFGFYENAFRAMRQCYEELGRDPDEPLATWHDAFKPCDQIVLYDGFDDWRGISFDVPRNDSIPGDGDGLPDFWDIAQEMLDYLWNSWGQLKLTNEEAAAARRVGPARLPFGMDRMAMDVLTRLLRRAEHPEDALLAALGLAQQRSARGLGARADAEHRTLLWGAIDDFKTWLWEAVVAPNVDDDDLRFFFTQFDAGTTMLQGIVEDRLIDEGFDAANGEDLRDWLLRHGAQDITVHDGPFVRALYDMAFAYEGGDVERPAMAAGTALHDMLRLFFTYRGAFAWKMEAGMGDTVFTPFYRVLERRGVKFKLFHWVTRLGLSADRSRVAAIEVIPQVRLKNGSYDPFVRVKDLDCWPSKPHWDQIERGDELRDRGVNLEWEPNPLGHAPETLRLGEDFDQVVLGISVAALPPICAELVAESPRFGEMLEHSRTVMTQGFQLWLKRPTDRLGWPFQPNSVMTSYVEPLDTYADMTHLLPAEAWPASERVASIGYFCGVLPDQDGDTQERALARTRANVVEYLERDALGIWPDADRGDGAFRWASLVDPAGRRGPQRVDAQFWVANFQPTERYVLTPPGSLEHRLAADESGFRNLFLAGDWVKTGLDAGCVEAAVMGGMQAARAICGSPEVVVGEDQSWLAGVPAGARPRRLPRYVDYGGLATCPSPVDCDDAKLYGFFLEADHARLAALCERVFAEPSGGRIELVPLGHHVMLSFGIVEKIRAQREPWSRMGFARERQAALWVPVVAIDDTGDRPVAVSLAWFVPYMWVDNPISLAGGREIYGFNKNWGEIDLPDDDGLRGLALRAFGGDFDGEQRAGIKPLIEVAPRGHGAPRRDGGGWDGVDGLASVVRDLLGRRAAELVAHARLEIPDELFRQIVVRGGPPQIFLKQFRSVADGARAGSQEISEAGTTLKRMSGRPLLGEFDVRLHALDSHPIEAELGIRSQTTAMAFEVEMDFVLDEGTVLWRGPGG